ncbi:uncharacterized protein LOC111089259, partial [Limulus polyphemus]|uniref:Uncharacterized protein LOC111089259 n=1 Tax=Limulus polyphemus TaxID=6850 RepID=A0ABM1TMM3_LIMPO
MVEGHVEKHPIRFFLSSYFTPYTSVTGVACLVSVPDCGSMIRIYLAQVLTVAYTGQLVLTVAHTGQPVLTVAYTGQLVLTVAHTGQPVHKLAHTGQPVLIVGHTGQPVLTVAHTGQLVLKITQTGECADGNLCHHNCYDLHDGTFECSCDEGYTLAKNGYTCIENVEKKPSKEKVTKEQQFDNKTIITGSRTEGAPSNIPESLSQTQKDYDKSQNYEHQEAKIEFTSNLVDGAVIGVKYHGIQKPKLDVNKSKSTSQAPVNFEVNQLFQPMNTITITTPSTPRYVKCQELECKFGGACIPDPSTEGIKCSCPLGRGGFFCEKAVELKYPKFVGSSYLALPVLRDAHKVTHISLEFRPESYDGILLYSGGHADLHGDFVALTLSKGFVEF